MFYKIVNIIFQFCRFLSKFLKFFSYFEFIYYKKTFGAPSVFLVAFCC